MPVSEATIISVPDIVDFGQVKKPLENGRKR